MDVLPGFWLWRWPYECATLALAIAPFLTVVRNWATLPALIPAHFDFLGRADRFGKRWTIWLQPCLAVALYVIFQMKMHLLPWNDASMVDTRIVPALAPASLLVGALIAYTCVMTVKVARREATGLNRTVFNTLIGLIVVHAIAASLLWKK